MRCSTSLAYLKPAENRPNLTVMTGCLVEKILLDGRTATGVAIVRQGERRTIRAARETILSAGTVGSPHLLMLSGIGDRAALAEHGIASAANLPGVGADLQDHVVAPLRFTAPAGFPSAGN